ncbi:MAG: response regulator [Candidatus Pacebacteria bacterium]|nr:response regulator [Candidatus Paceibacterota bacterium]
MIKKEMLLVDDDREFADEFLEYIEVSGISAYYAENAEKARNTFGDLPDISVVLMDYNMKGGGNTFLLTQEFLAARKIVVIAISNSKEGREKLAEAGCAYQCSKEKFFQLGELIEKIFAEREAELEKSLNT